MDNKISGSYFFSAMFLIALTIFSALVFFASLGKEPLWYVLCFFIATAICIYGLIQGFLYMADDVYDHGDYLLVIKKGEAKKILFRDLAQIKFYGRRGLNSYIFLHLKRPCPSFGKKIIFKLPVFSDEIGYDLKSRIKSTNRDL